MCILLPVIYKMNSNQNLLSSLLKTTQQGQVQIRSLLDSALHPQLRSTLRSQLRELEAIESSALTIALQRGWELSEMDFLDRFLTDRVTRIKVTGCSSDSRIADLLIRMHTKGMNRGLREIHRLSGEDAQLRILSQRLLDCQTANIRQMQLYL